MKKTKPKETVTVHSETKIDPTLPVCFQVAAATASSFAHDAIFYIDHAHKQHELFSDAVDMYISTFIAIFHALPISDDQKELIKGRILHLWEQQKVIQAQGNLDAVRLKGEALN